MIRMSRHHSARVPTSFKDRGAVDRADFQGPSANLIVPFDNDADGIDLDPTETVVQLGQGEILSQMTIQLVDRGENADAAGIGVDDDSVRSEKVSVTMDGILLEEGVDYVYRYDSTTNNINLTHVSGVWPDDKVYVVRLNNTDRFVIDSPNGSEVADGDAFFHP